MQRDLRFRTVTGGEIRRRLHWGSFFTNLEGFEEVKVTDFSVFRPYFKNTKLFTEADEEGASVVICTGKIKHVRSSFLHEFEYLKSLVEPDRVKDIKMSLSSLELYHLIYKQGYAYPSSVYASDDEYFADLAVAFREEVKILYKAGLRNLQIDDPSLTYFCDPDVHQGWAQDKLNSRTSSQQIDAYIKLINDSIQNFPDDIHFSFHLCTGDFKSGHWASGGYDLIATKLFKNCSVDTFYLEFDTGCSGGFEPLKKLPIDKRVVLGLITSQTGELEDLRNLQRGVREAAKFMAEGSGQTEAEAVQRISVSPQCGFASANVGHRITKEDVIRKLQLVRELADTVWPGEP
ncbi:hypothetical protein TMatcc_004771 [Talaromyces marneffei ATCC 18224]|uniref:Cobalamin-independent methionine synthase MetE C-terminal/archaeal domain-containing protein n=1 Tax=Talaromyces marneffei (strain ATCC 18224 / CBS 334.59 / QM 7333) TaxID=441960 RepID=B6Q2J1_TALMQ|nr:uncharacterized protein EYB26_000306 [Talaromyces marneffei]EEA26948.1 conserved hypothetical protein [Talaromyces marneffei ATCC 18224]KAE8557320.1 hypothetical protein EYB25_002027 [Talaromyces marneffei]QGA12662.1 hypothetical protein EYB26_000306 [Talaromyces marneffei]